MLLKLKESKQLEFWADNIPARKIFILVSGRAGVGKSLVAKLITEKLNELGYKATQRNFADRVKDAAIDYFGWDGEKDDRGRKLLQQVGNTGREYNKDVWVSQLVENTAYDYTNSIVVVGDWRFPNERQYLRNMNFQIVTVRVESPERESLKGTEYYNDVSETSLPDYNSILYDLVLINLGSVEGLKADIDNFIERHF